MIEFMQAEGNVNFNDQRAIKAIDEASEKLKSISTQIKTEGGVFYLETIGGYLHYRWKNFSPQLSDLIGAILS